MPEKRWMIYLFRVYEHWFFFNHLLNFFEILVKTPVLFWSVGMIKLVLSSKRSLSESNVSSKFYGSDKQDIFQLAIFARGHSFVPLNLKISLVVWITVYQNCEENLPDDQSCQRYKIKILSVNFFTMFFFCLKYNHRLFVSQLLR